MSAVDPVKPTAFDLTGRRWDDLPKVRTLLEFLFALLTAAGGLLLGSGQIVASPDDAENIALLAVFSAAFGFLFVDWMRVIELPPVGAYLAMAAAAAYCVRDFWDLQQRGEPQMGSVALLLVLVQGVLMLQRKSRRILEQLAVFCLLELVVAAIFSDAIHFGLLMIPIALVGAAALSLLALVMTIEGIDVTLDRRPAPEPKTRIGRVLRFIAGHPDDDRPPNAVFASSSPASIRSMYLSAKPWSRYAVLSLAPSVLLVAAAFFYVLPRKIEPSRSTSAGPALVGFDDQIRLEQLGEVMQTSKTAVKVKLTDTTTGEPYLVQDSLYLRGKVLERYQVNYSSPRPVATWVSTDAHSLSRRSRLPTSYPRASIPTDVDEVAVEITCESMNRPALFSIAPYRAREDGDAEDPDVVHAIDRWTLSRDYPKPPFPRIKYGFTTSAFAGGTQTRWISQASERERAMTSYGLGMRSLIDRGPRGLARRPNIDLLRFDRRSLPTVSRLALQVIDAMPAQRRTQSGIALELERFLATDAQFTYTLKLDANPIPNVDPIEQFLSVDRRGHCQYFASSLALMLRSVGIPCRIVVGYRTEEYNRVRHHYIARQQHAHAWVEALVDASELPPEARPADHRSGDRFWMRLDPTPAASAIDDGNQEGVEGLVNMANNFWEDYVVEMDSQRQSEDLVEAAGLGKLQDSYRNLFERLEQGLADVRAGRLGGGRLSLRGDLPIWPFLGIGFVAALLLLLRRIRPPHFFRRRRGSGNRRTTRQPELRFYADALAQLQRLGIERLWHETPDEFRRRAGPGFPSLGFLTDLFQRRRYGHFDIGEETEKVNNALNELAENVEQRLASGKP